MNSRGKIDILSGCRDIETEEIHLSCLILSKVLCKVIDSRYWDLRRKRDFEIVNTGGSTESNGRR